MTPQDYEALQARLRSLADPAYRAFQQKLVPDVTNLLGVRVPALRQLARELVRGDWRGYLEAARHETYEETMLQGLVLGCARMEQNELFARLCRTLTIGLSATLPAAVCAPWANAGNRQPVF